MKGLLKLTHACALTFIFTFVLSNQTVLAQDPMIEWQNTIGGISDDRLNSIQQTTDGGYILGGFSTSSVSGDKTENNQGAWDYWVVKLDTSGNIQWQNTIGGNDWDRFYSIQQTTDGGYILGGDSKSGISGDKTENSQGGFDYWVLKLDASGNIQWQNTIGGSDDDVLYSIQQTTDGGYILGGESQSDISGDKTENSQGMEDYWVVKLDTSGNIQWQNTIGGISDDRLNSIQQTTDGGYILGGESYSNTSGDKTENNQGSWDYWVLKLDTSGNIQWQNTIGGSGADYLYSIQQTTDGGYILGGFSGSNISGDKTENSQGNDDYWVLKLDASGNIKWQNTIGGNVYDALKSIQQTTDGGYILGGWSYSNISGDKTENSQGSIDYWVLKLKGDPNLICGKVYFDLNLNNQIDSTEPGYQNGIVQSMRQSIVNSSAPSSKGLYYLTVDTGSWTTTFLPNNPNYVTVLPTNQISNFGNQGSQIDTVNFALQLIPGHPDLCIDIIPLTAARAGFDVRYRLVAKNVGTDTISGDVQFTHDALLSYVSSSPIYDTYASSVLTWNFTGFAPLEIKTYDITLNIPPTPATNIGDLLNSDAVINPVPTDETPGNNIAAISHEVTGSFDPNDKWVSEETIISTALPYNQHLDYLIRFQNTGNDTAFKVIIRDTLSYLLDQSTLRIFHSSHDYLVIKRDTNVLEFQFNNILLPDSNINESASHGYVAYQIKPKSTFAVGDKIQNTAKIYFDYNPPILTNTVITEAVITTPVIEAGETLPLTVFPNPTEGLLTIKAKGLQWHNAKIKLFNALGQLSYEEKVNKANATECTIDIGKQKAGVYQLSVETIEHKYSTKIIIE